MHKYKLISSNYYIYLGGEWPFIFQVPTNIVISLFGQTLSSSGTPKSELAPTLPCRKFLCLALLVGMRYSILKPKKIML